jgi:hypothetical protein
MDLSVEELRLANILDSWDIPETEGGMDVAVRRAVRAAGVPSQPICPWSTASVAPVAGAVPTGGGVHAGDSLAAALPTRSISLDCIEGLQAAEEVNSDAESLERTQPDDAASPVDLAPRLVPPVRAASSLDAAKLPDRCCPADNADRSVHPALVQEPHTGNDDGEQSASEPPRHFKEEIAAAARRSMTRQRSSCRKSLAEWNVVDNFDIPEHDEIAECVPHCFIAAVLLAHCTGTWLYWHALAGALKVALHRHM